MSQKTYLCLQMQICFLKNCCTLGDEFVSRKTVVPREANSCTKRLCYVSRGKFVYHKTMLCLCRPIYISECLGFNGSLTVILWFQQSNIEGHRYIILWYLAIMFLF